MSLVVHLLAWLGHETCIDFLGYFRFQKVIILFKLHEIGSVDSQKIIKIVATRCHILRLKCIKFDFGWGSAPNPAGGAYSAPPDPLA